MTENDTRIWAYGPNGEAEIFPGPEAIPAGWALSPGEHQRHDEPPAPIVSPENPAADEGGDDIPPAPADEADGDDEASDRADFGPDAPRRRGRPPKAV